MLPVSSETYTSNLSAGISAGAATVPVNSATAYADGDSVVLTVDPGTANQATFVGTKQGSTFINCKWTEGNVGASHSTGAVITDYDSSTHYNLVTKAVRAHANQDGTLKTSAVQAALNISSAVPADWTPLANVPSVISSNGQREHVIRFTSVDYTDRLQPGMKLRIPRTGTTPTTSFAFSSASSQYGQKTSPAGITFTSTYTAEAWIYLNSYPTGSAASIIGRSDGSNAWVLQINPSGQLSTYVNAGGTNWRGRKAYQSVPLNKWIHVAYAQTTADGTGVAYMDGVAVPDTADSGGTVPTSITQAGDLRVGSLNNASSYAFNGQIANVRVWSAIRTAAQIRDNMNMENPASTTGLVAHFKGNGSWNDSSSNANHLTAAGGAVNNFASHPYSANEYAIATNVSYTGGNTDVTVFTGSNCIPNETLGTTSYSTARAPYGFPADKTKWRVEMLNIAGYAPVNNSGTIALNRALTIPTGAWAFGYDLQITQTLGANGLMNSTYGVDTVSGVAPSDAHRLASSGTIVNATEHYPTLHREMSLATAAQVTYYLNARAIGTNFTAQGLRGLPSVMYAECAYL